MSFLGFAAPAPAAGGFLFGSTSTPAPAPAGTFSFKTASTASTPAPASSFGFGTPAPAPTSGVFGSTPAPSSSAFGFGAPATAPAATGGFGAAPAAVTPGQEITPETRYDQLPEAARKSIDGLAVEIKRQRSVADEVSRTNPTHGLELQAQIRQLRRELLDLGNEQETQKLGLHNLKDDADRTVKQAEVHGTFVVQRMHSQSGLNTVEQLPSAYMREMADSFEKRLIEYAQEISAIKQQLSDEPLQGGGEVQPLPYGQRARVTPERLAFVIREQWKTFNQIAGHAAVAHEQIEALRQSYKQQFKDDPFEAAERQERAAERRLLKQMRDQAPPQAETAPAPTPPAAAASQCVTFGTPAPASSALAFGTTPAPSAFGTSAFGTSAPAPSAFGTTPAPAALAFGTTPAPSAFSTTPVPAPSAFRTFAATTAPAPSASGLFGTPAPAPKPAGGLFGAAPAFGTPTPGLFTSAPATPASAFSGTPAPAPTSGFGLFASKAAPAPSTSFTSSTKKKNKGNSRNRRGGGY